MIVALILACCLQAPAEITVDADRLTLGTVLPIPKGDARADVVLGYAPQPGIARRFTKPELLSRISAAGLSSAGLDLPDSVLVRRKAEMLDPERVRLAVQEAFARQYPKALVTILSINVPQTTLGTGSVELTATIPPRSDLSGPLFIRVDIRGEGVSKNIFVRTVADALIPQLVLRNPVAAGKAVSSEDVELIAVPLRGLAVPIASLETVEGFVASTDLKPGQTLTKDLLYAPLLVRKGESVTVKASTGGVTIAATMRAKSDARFGDTIVVEHLTGIGSSSARVVGVRSLEALKGVR
jgi:flagella basal body P-ring formation protein FlgA